MKKLRERALTALLCVLCAAALALPALAADLSDALDFAEASETTQTVIPDADALPDNDELFYGYLLRLSGASDSAELLSDSVAGDKLGEKDRELYDKLKDLVTKIAAGEETSSVLTITYDDFPLTWTAADLGVSDCFSDEGGAAIQAKIKECYNYNTRAVLNSLLADCPYELYWYDKVTGSSYGGSGSSYSGSSASITLKSAPKFTYTMKVAANYQGGNNTTVNRALHTGIDNVVSTAQGIVSKYAAQSDYDKLLGYSTEICNLVEYDYDAANNGSSSTNIDPWQLINVFDGDTSTNVVCEGYSKAFKYLCDLSAFNSSKTHCYLVEGALGSSGQAATGAGPHMWNVVTMDNGKSYLVDVTNSDPNGGPERFLLRGGAPDDAEATQYTFDNWIIFKYGANTVSQWGSELLTLDTVDYKDADPVPVDAPVQIQGCSLTLTDDIALNFYLAFEEDVLSDANAYVKLSGKYDSDAQTLKIADAFSGTVDGVEGTVYRFTANLPAKRMNDKITLSCYSGANVPYTMNQPDGTAVTEYAYSVADYLALASARDDLKDLAAKMAAYGYYAQIQFNYDTANAVAPSVSLDSVTAETLSAYAPADSGSVAGLTPKGDNLTLDSAVTQRYIFDISGALSDYTFKIDGKSATATSYDGSYCLEVPNVVAKNMDAAHTLTVSKGDETFTHTCSTLSYAHTALSGTQADANLKNLVKAMYLYHEAAKAYFNA